MEDLVNKKCSTNQALEMGLSKEEFNFICNKINKIPNVTETGICSAMFSEHCSYKSTKKWLKILPTYGESFNLKLKNLILPSIVLGIRPLAVISQLVRNELLHVLNQDYIRTARAKGLSQIEIIKNHALKNALNPVVTVISGWFASLLAGAVFVEFIFGWNGIGKEIVNALNLLDLPVIMGAVLVIAFIFIIINILVDIIYIKLDPRIKIN